MSMFRTSFAPPLIDSSLVNWWKFDSGSGSTVYDSSRFNNTGTLVNSPSWVFGRNGGYAIAFNGSSYMNVQRRVADDMTITAWIKTTGVGNGTGHWQGMQIYDAEVGGGSNDFGFGISSNGKLTYGNGNGVVDFGIASSASVNSGVWTFVSATRVKASSNMSLYINGAFSISGSGSPNSLTGLTVASIGNGFDGGKNWSGLMDDVRVYNRALSPTEITFLYRAGV